MAPMTDPNLLSRHAVETFYDRLAPDYDAMTTFEKRFVQEGPFFRLLVQRYGITSALDAGCGTGFHSIALAQLGVSVTAVDVSSRMLLELERHIVGLGLDIRTMRADFAGLPSLLNGPFDAVFCMGNTLAHLLTQDELREALRAFAAVLSPGGILFTQVLNYDRILQTHPEIQNTRETPQGIFTRSYDYCGDTIRFTIRKQASPGEERTQSVELRPVLAKEFSLLLEETGFTDIHVYGSVAMEEFEPATSRDFVVLARPGGSDIG